MASGFIGKSGESIGSTAYRHGAAEEIQLSSHTSTYPFASPVPDELVTFPEVPGAQRPLIVQGAVDGESVHADGGPGRSDVLGARPFDLQRVVATVQQAAAPDRHLVHLG